MMALGCFRIPLNMQCRAVQLRKPPPIRIKKVDSNFEREPMIPYRFKGSAITEGWQVAAYLESDSGIHKIGLGGQGILWSDAKVFFSHSVTGGNALMYAMSESALQIDKRKFFYQPYEIT